MHIVYEVLNERAGADIRPKKIHLSPDKWIFCMVAEEGFEPSQTESESVVLPLHNSASQENYIAFQGSCQYLFYNYTSRERRVNLNLDNRLIKI